jgi:hypothetical protein
MNPKEENQSAERRKRTKFLVFTAKKAKMPSVRRRAPGAERPFFLSKKTSEGFITTKSVSFCLFLKKISGFCQTAFIFLEREKFQDFVIFYKKLDFCIDFPLINKYSKSRIWSSFLWFSSQNYQ